jgi:hypothetical protein
MDPLLEQALNRLGKRIKQRTHEREAQAAAALATPPATALIIPFPPVWMLAVHRFRQPGLGERLRFSLGARSPLARFKKMVS